MFQMKIAFVLLPLLAQLCSCKSFGSSDGELLKSPFTKDRLEQFRDILAEAMDPYVFPRNESLFLQPNRNTKVYLTLIKGTQIRGISKLVFQAIEVTEDDMTVSLSVSVPRIEVDGEYDAIVKISAGGFEDESNGKMLVTLAPLRGTIHLTIDRSSDGSSLEAKRLKIIGMRIGKVDITLKDKKDKEDVIKRFIRGKTEALFDEQIRPVLQPKLENILQTSLNQLLSQTP